MLQYAAKYADFMKIIENFIGVMENPVEIIGNPKKINEHLMKIEEDPSQENHGIPNKKIIEKLMNPT